ncbi:MAG: HAD-IA family hydrolase [Gammaproteobacteria bacterium]|nr:HAD-IA family hydrolase [Gammaproteobacteria bacterium]
MKALPYQLLIFDWDGTLMDSEARIVDCLSAACLDHGFTPPPNEQLKDVIGLGLREALKKLHPEENETVIEKLADSYRQQYLESNQTHSELFPGVKELLEVLEQQGYWLAIATGKGRQGLDMVLQETQLHSRFHITRCASETCSKPHPQMLEEILQFTGLEAHQALMIGDTEYDMEMAKNAKIDALAVSYGVHAVDRLLKHKPVDCLHDIRELPDCLNKLNQEQNNDR